MVPCPGLIGEEMLTKQSAHSLENVNTHMRAKSRQSLLES